MSTRRRRAVDPRDADLDRYLEDGRTALYLIRKWGTVDLIALMPLAESEASFDVPPAEREKAVIIGSIANSDCPVAVQFDHGQNEGEIWPLESLVERWVLKVNLLYLTIDRLKRGVVLSPRGRDLRAWVEETIALADGVSVLLGATIAEQMRQTAQALDNAFTWAAEHVLEPADDPAGLLNFFLSAHIWALDQFIATINDDSIGHRFSRTGTLHDVLSPVTDALVEATLLETPPDKHAWKRRADRFDKNVKGGHRDALMARVIWSLRDSPPQ